MLSCLTRMDHVARIVAEARAVIEGSARSAQWLIPCDGLGNPVIGGVRSVLELARASGVTEKPRERAVRGKPGRRRRVQQQLSKAS